MSDQIRCCVALTEAVEAHIYDAELFSLSTADMRGRVTAVQTHTGIAEDTPSVLFQVE